MAFDESRKKASQKKNTKYSKEHEVGYGKPPRENRFKKGISGNPKGRPKATFSAARYLNEVMSARVIVAMHGHKKSITGLEAIMWSLRTQMLKGDLKAFRMYLMFCEKFGVSMGRTQGQDRLDELRAAIEAGPVPPGQTNAEVERDFDDDE